MQLGIEIYGRLGACYCAEIEFVSCELRFGRFFCVGAGLHEISCGTNLINDAARNNDMRIAAGVPPPSPAHTDWCRRSSWLSVIKRTAMFCYINDRKLRAAGITCYLVLIMT